LQVFVYGTLKQGYGNNRILSSGQATLVGEDVVEGYELYYSGFPVANPNPLTAVRGEVWDIGDPLTDERAASTLARLDGLEGVPHMYTRENVVTRGGREVGMYVGGKNCWRNFVGMEHCHIDGNEHYWSR